MADFLFWLFTLVTALLIPVCMLFLGRRFQKNPPKTINSGFGYRSARSMRSQAAWDFAQVYSGRFWFRAGPRWRCRWRGCFCSWGGTSVRWAPPPRS